VKTDRLVTVASFGDEMFERYATSLDPKSLAGRVAASETATVVRDITTTALEVPESLRTSGIHSVLGVRVPPLSRFHGILYVGVAETREFSSREIHRLELLADRLALHLENARLFADLHENIDALQVERGMRERFVATLAHDLRGPLAAARLAADLLSQSPVSLDKRADLAGRIVRNIDRVDRMVRDLLDANRLRAGEPLPLRLDACALCPLLRGIGEEARAMWGERFVVDCEDATGVWSADELHRAVWNLVANAVKYGAPEQAITITGAVADHTVRISVHNLGEPIPTEELAALFDPFHRAVKADSGIQLGWGLGLTLVRGCAEAHGGHAEVASDRTGTTFTIELPLDATAFQRDQRSAREATIH
jgi:signal transduction histidine kinase